MFLLENLWSHYGEYRTTVEKENISSEVASSSDPDSILKDYVVNDMATFFTLLVGIYFPSVTGTVSFLILSLNRLLKKRKENQTV